MKRSLKYKTSFKYLFLLGIFSLSLFYTIPKDQANIEEYHHSTENDYDQSIYWELFKTYVLVEQNVLQCIKSLSLNFEVNTKPKRAANSFLHIKLPKDFKQFINVHLIHSIG